MEKLDFVVYYTIFIIFIAQIVGMMATDLTIVGSPIKNAPDFSPKTQIPTNVLGGSIWIFSNFANFFKLMFVSSDFAFFTLFIITPYIIGMFWCLLEIIKDLVPTT